MWRLLTGEIIKGETDETPVAVGTKFGWVLSGVVADIPRSLLSAVNLTTTHLLRVECQSQVVGNPIADKVLDRKVNELFERKLKGYHPEVQKTIESETESKPETKSKIENDESVSLKPAKQADSTPLQNTEAKVLGMNWDFESDDILLKFEKFVSLSKELSPTKRNLLKLAASVFDPIGFVSPVLVRMKMLLQETCLLKLEWDTPLPENLSSVWFEIVKDLDKVVEIAIKRCYFGKENGVVDEYNLHGFCDASEKAYCAVFYLVYRKGNRYESNLIASKSRVAPVKKLTIPRLELMGALIMTRLMNTVKAALATQISFNSFWYWSDSTIVLSWLKNDANYKQFVSHRTKEILKSTSPENWHHCPTDFNPADVGSRGQLLSALNETTFGGLDTSGLGALKKIT